MILIGWKGYTLCLVFSRSAGSTIERVVVVVVVVVVSIVYFPHCCSSGGPSSGKLEGGFWLALCALSSLEEFNFFATFDAGPILLFLQRHHWR